MSTGPNPGVSLDAVTEVTEDVADGTAIDLTGGDSNPLGDLAAVVTVSDFASTYASGDDSLPPVLSVVLQVSLDDTVWVTVGNEVVFSANGTQVIRAQFPARYLRNVLTVADDRITAFSVTSYVSAGA